MDERFLTAAQTAERTGVAAETIREWARAGTIPGYRPGGREWLFLWSEVAEAIRTAKHQPAQVEPQGPRRPRPIAAPAAQPMTFSQIRQQRKIAERRGARR